MKKLHEIGGGDIYKYRVHRTDIGEEDTVIGGG